MFFWLTVDVGDTRANTQNRRFKTSFVVQVLTSRVAPSFFGKFDKIKQRLLFVTGVFYCAVAKAQTSLKFGIAFSTIHGRGSVLMM